MNVTACVVPYIDNSGIFLAAQSYTLKSSLCHPVLSSSQGCVGSYDNALSPNNYTSLIILIMIVKTA